MQEEMDRLRQRLRQDREVSEAQQADIIDHMQKAMEAARMKLNEERNAARRQAAFLERCRVEANSARAAFEADVKRRQAFFDASDRHKQRREAERQRAAEEQRRREATGYGDDRFGGHSGASLGPVIFISTQAQAAAYEEYEHAFATFEEAADDEARYTLASMPWPPKSCPVSGARRGEAAEVRKQRLKIALLRWRPDKFLAAHAGKFVESEREKIVEAASAVLRRVQAERAAAESESSSSSAGGSGSSHAVYTSSKSPSSTTGSMSAAAAAAAAEATAERMAAVAAAQAAAMAAQAVREAAAAAGREAAAARSTHAATAAGPGTERFYFDKENLRAQKDSSSPLRMGGNARPARTPPPGSGPRGPAYARATRPIDRPEFYTTRQGTYPAPRSSSGATVTRPSKRFPPHDQASTAGPRTSKYLYEGRYSH